MSSANGGGRRPRTRHPRPFFSSLLALAPSCDPGLGRPGPSFLRVSARQRPLRRHVRPLCGPLCDAPGSGRSRRERAPGGTAALQCGEGGHLRFDWGSGRRLRSGRSCRRRASEARRNRRSGCGIGGDPLRRCPRGLDSGPRDRFHEARPRRSDPWWRQKRFPGAAVLIAGSPGCSPGELPMRARLRRGFAGGGGRIGGRGRGRDADLRSWHRTCNLRAIRSAD